jgi:hypothetical protein
MAHENRNPHETSYAFRKFETYNETLEMIARILQRHESGVEGAGVFPNY